MVPPSKSSTYFDGSDDTPSFKRVIAELLLHTRAWKLQQPEETVQSSFTSSPIKTHDFVIPKEVDTPENIQIHLYAIRHIE